MRRALPIAVLVALSVPAAAQDRAARLAEASADRPFVSPAGEVFRPDAGGERPAARWFAQADANHDGALDLAEFRADFARAFTAFDRGGDGEIDPDDVHYYETVLLPEMATRPGAGMQGRGGRLGRRLAQRRGGGERAEAARAMLQGAARYSLLPIAHPIMEADADFNRGVSRAEFAAAADRRFAMLDAAHDGRLVLADMAARRMEQLRALAPGRASR